MTLSIVEVCLNALRPSPKILPSIWAEQNIVLPQSSNARPGALKLTKYQRGLVDVAVEPGIRIAVFMLGAQIGKSVAQDVILANAIANDPCPVLCAFPTEAKCFSYVRDRLDPMIAATPALKTLVGAGAKGIDSKSAKSWPGGTMNVASSHKPDDLSSRAIRLLLGDEIDRWAASAGVEGDPVKLAIKRTTTYRNSFTCLASTPTFRGSSRIAAWHDRGDCRKFFVPCIECGSLAPLSPERLVFTPGAPETAYLKCLDCGHKATEAERLRMVRIGDWIATTEGEPGVASFHANELVSEFSSLETVARAVDAAKTLEAKRVLTNLVWGEPFEAQSEITLVPSEVQARAETIVEPYPSQIHFITSATDVQSNRLECQFLAVAKSGEKWILDHITLPGDTSGDAVWRDLDVLLGRTFKLQSGAVLPLSASIIDAGFQTTMVANFVSKQRARSRRCFASVGRAGFNKQTIQEGSKLRGGNHRVMILGVDGVKLSAQKLLTVAAGQPGCIHLPDHMDSGWFDQMCAERLEPNFVRGFSHPRWVKSPGDRNEAFDCLVANLCVASLVKNPFAALNAPKTKIVPLAERVANFHKNQ